jgi:hypothetical protein
VTAVHIAKGQSPIESIEDWKRHAPPKAAHHWDEGHSAFELARAWCGGGAAAVPPEVLRILDSRAETRGAILTSAEPECCLHFDQLGGEPRNADLAITALRDGEPIAIAVEAKADESYGELTSQALAASVERALAQDHSNGLLRIEQLARALLPPHRRGLPRLGRLRYQLLTAAAGALALAQKTHAAVAVMLVHEFVTKKTTDAKHVSNHRDLEAFVLRLSDGLLASVATDQLIGPFVVPGLPLFAKPAKLFIGKSTRNLRG